MVKKKQEQPLTPEEIKAAEDQIRERQSEVKYDLRDFTIDYLVDAFKDDLFFIPEYQREFIWPDKNKSKFVESVILGLPIPMLFVADMADGRLEIVDGAQRIQTLEQFLAGDLKLESLTLLSSLNGFTVNDLPVPQQRKLKTRALRVVVLEDGTSEVIRQELFHRINTQSVKARGSEVRRGSFAGPFIQFIKVCANDPLFLKLCPISKSALNRRENEELVTRFFCYSDRYQKFKHDVDKFVDIYVEEHKNNYDKQALSAELKRTMEFVAKYFPNGFAKAKNATTTPRVRFEAIAVGVNLALRIDPNLAPNVPVSEWLTSPEFIDHTTTHASNSGPRLRSRIEYVRNQLLGQ
jgi:hypothetical protein